MRRSLADFIDQAAEVQARAHRADGAGQHVIEHQRRNRELGQRAAHRLVHHFVHAAAHEHRAALDVDGAHRVGKQHDRQDEPRRCFADGLFGDAAYVVGGIAEQAIGKAAPWFILAIMLFSYAVRAIYIESCSMFVRGGVYKVVHEAMGGTLAKFSVSALMFDYVLTGPISAVSAGLYLGGLINETGELLEHPRPARVSALFRGGIRRRRSRIYFWRKNIIGIHESSEKALRIMQITTVMVVILIAWCLITIFKSGYQPVPLPMLANLHFSTGSAGLAARARWRLPSPSSPSWSGLGHSLLAMSGEESLAQVNREIAHPKLKNLERAGFVIFIYSMLFTSLVSFFAVMIIPDAARQQFLDNLIGGLSMFLVGPVVRCGCCSTASWCWWAR